MSLSSPGVGSGLDVNALVSQLVAAERAPSDQRFARIESTTKAQITAFGALKSAMSGLQGALKRFDADGALPGRKVNVAIDAGFSATAGTTARLGSYQVQVNRLASAHKLQSAVAASTTQIGYGQLSITVGSDAPLLVNIAQGSGTLANIRDAINTAAAGKGVTATVVHGDTGDVLSLNSTRTGAASALVITASGGNGGLGVLATTGGTMTQMTPAQDAQVVIDGITRTSASNTLVDAIDGVTLTLTKVAAPAAASPLEIATDPSPLKATLLGFVSAYNTALSQVRTQSASGGAGKVAGPLSGDSAPRSMMQSLRGTVASSYGDLAALGITTAVDGSLTMDGAKFDTALAADSQAVDRIFNTTAPLGSRLRSTLDSYVGIDGLLPTRSTALDARTKALARDRESFDARMLRVEQAYRRQFTALDVLMSKMQSTSSYLSQQLASLTNKP